MTIQSAAELEREAEAVRAHVTETADAIRQKMTPGQLIDEFAGMFSGGDTSAAINNLKSQVRDNPLPLALIATGLAWLTLGPPVTTSFKVARASRASDDVGMRMSEGEHYQDPKDTSSAPGEEGGNVLQDVAGRIGDAAVSATNSAQGIASNVNASAFEAVRGEPLILAAVGLVMGTVAGALLPKTELETEQLGPVGEDLRGQAEAVMQEGLEEAKTVAGKTYESLKEEADNRLRDEGTIAEKVSDIVRGAATKAEETVRERLGEPKQG